MLMPSIPKRCVQISASASPDQLKNAGTNARQASTWTTAIGRT
jgi:hypothetical protein